ncbi:MAG: integrase [Ruminococcaceae bacterium]|nr:integrase [Oscillospiraceae bacterium]
MKQITYEITQQYKEYLYNEEKSNATIEKYMRDIVAFKKWCGKKILSKKTVLEYKSYLIDNYAPASTNSMLSSLNSFFDYNRWYELKTKTLKIQRRIFASSETDISKNEYERLLVAARRKENRRLYYLMQTICSTGIRVSELRFITKEAVDSRQAVINLKGKMRVVILPNELCIALKKYISKEKIKSGPVFITKTGNPLNRSNIWRDMKKLCESAMISPKKVFPHNLRHLFAKTYYSLQKDIVRLADILGHSSINTTRIYTMENGEIHRRQIQSLGLVRLII